MSGFRRKMLRRQIVGHGNPSKRMQRDHTDVLQNVEFVFATSYREDEGLDDRIIARSLESALTRQLSTDPRVFSILERLESIRDHRSDVSDQVWDDAMRTVLQSVRRHSTLQPGETGYLDFICLFVM